MIFEVWGHMLWLVNFFHGDDFLENLKVCKCNYNTAKMVWKIESVWIYTLIYIEYLKS